MKIYLCTALSLLTLAGCTGEEKKDYAAIARCQAKGLTPGTASYDQCITDERTARLMEQQRQEYEQMKRNEQDWKLRRY